MITPSQHAIDSIQQDETISLTRLQKLYWTGQSLRPTAPIFNTIQLFHIDGDVDEERFQGAFQRVGETTDTMRMLFVEQDGKVRQSSVPYFSFQLPVFDLTTSAGGWESWVANRAKRQLQLEKCSFDAALLKLEPQAYLFYFNQHHILLDARTATILFERLKAFYEEGKRGGETAVFPTFASHVARDATYMQSAKFEKAAVFWQKQLQQPPQPSRFFGKLPQRQGSNVQRMVLSVPPEQADPLRSLARSKPFYTLSDEFSLTTIFATLFFLQLHGLSGNDQLGVVMPMHNRLTTAAQQTAGLLMEMCPLAISISNDDTFHSLLKRIKQRSFKITPHAAYGSNIALPQGTFDVMFNFHTVEPMTLDKFVVHHETSHPGHGSDSLALHVHDYGDGKPLLLKFDFHHDVFSVAERAKVIAQFEELLLWVQSGANGTVESVTTAVFPTFSSYSKLVKDDALPSPSLREHVAPTSPLEQQLVDIWQKVLNLPQVGIRDNFFALGGSSWLAVRLFDEIQAVTGTKLPVSTLLQAETVADLAALLADGGEGAAWSSLVPVRTIGSKPPFFCVHGVTGDILWLKELASLLDDEQPFFGLQARGLNGQDEPFNDMTLLADHYLQELRHVQPDGPYFLGGYCFGSHVAYEMAHRLCEAGEQVAILVAIDPPPEGGKTEMTVNGRFLFRTTLNAPLWAREFARLGGEEIFARAKRKGRLAVEKAWHKLTQRSGDSQETAAGDIIDRVDELEAYRHQIIEAHLQALKEHQPAGFSGKTIVFDARSRPLLDPTFPSQNWRGYVGEALQIEVVPGSHATMLQSPNVQVLANRLQRHLDQAAK